MKTGNLCPMPFRGVKMISLLKLVVFIVAIIIAIVIAVVKSRVGGA